MEDLVGKIGIGLKIIGVGYKKTQVFTFPNCCAAAVIYEIVSLSHM